MKPTTMIMILEIMMNDSETDKKKSIFTVKNRSKSKRKRRQRVWRQTLIKDDGGVFCLISGPSCLPRFQCQILRVILNPQKNGVEDDCAGELAVLSRITNWDELKCYSSSSWRSVKQAVGVIPVQLNRFGPKCYKY